MKHINITSWRGSITDWTKLNYIKGGLDDYYADIANVSGNVLRKLPTMEPNYIIPNAYLTSGGGDTITLGNIEGPKVYRFKVNKNTNYTYSVYGLTNQSSARLAFSNNAVVSYTQITGDLYEDLTTLTPSITANSGNYEYMYIQIFSLTISQNGIVKVCEGDYTSPSDLIIEDNSTTPPTIIPVP